MKKIFKKIALSLLSFVLSSVAFLIVTMLILQIVSSPARLKPKNNTILEIKLKGTLYDDVLPPSPLDKGNSKMSLINIIQAINFAKKDSRIKAIKLKIENFSAGWAALEEIRYQLEKFKKSKKLIFSFSEFLENKSLYLTSVCDRSYLHPEGMCFWSGMSAKYFYLKNLFHKLKIKPIEFHVGEYKDYIEKFSKEKMSDKSRQQKTEILIHIYDDLLNKMSISKGISKEKLRQYAAELSIKIAEDALKYKFIDTIGHVDDLEGHMKEKLQLPKKKDINYISVDNYVTYKNYKEKKYKSKQIAVLLAEGQIVGGKSKYGDYIGSESMKKTIKAIQKDKNIKAVILRINSPGGSVIASYDIWHNLKELKKVKPLVVSMGDVAASGGYYIASAADHGDILAYNNTITGSIGVLFLMFNTGDFMKYLLGVTNSIIKTEPHADIFNANWGLHRELDVAEKEFIEAAIKNNYKNFIAKVASARNMDVLAVDNIGRGRVWIGSVAKKINLVDKIGTFDDAVKLAKQKAKIKDGFMLTYYPKKKMFLEIILERVVEKIRSSLNLWTNIFDKNLSKDLEKLENMKGIQAILPYEIEIR